jgi:peptide/nickel transport system ATP-binding protein
MERNGPIIEVRGLTVDYWQQDRWATVIEDLSLHINPAETLGLVGESGCGKSTTANAFLGFRPRGARYRSGSTIFEGQDLLRLPDSALQRIRGGKISLVPQNPTTALSPAIRVGNQIVEVLMVHRYCQTAAEARERTLDLLARVGLPNPQAIFSRYPHQLSGGQQQRVIIAMALACDPKLIVLDEPTTGLDVTTQAQILDLLMDLQSRYGLAMLYVTHNLGVVAQICNRIGVMYAGQMVEVAPRHQIFKQPLHPYTQGLIASVPRISAPTEVRSLLLKGLLKRSELPPGCPFAPRCGFAEARCYAEHQPLVEVAPDHAVACWRRDSIPSFAQRMAETRSAVFQKCETPVCKPDEVLLKVDGLRAGYTRRRFHLFQRPLPTVIVDGVSFYIRPGETLALVGESGSGKTTVARALNGFLPYVTGELRFDGRYDLTLPVDRRNRDLLRELQLVFQNPDASLNPRQRVSQIIGRPLQLFFGLSGAELRQRIESLLEDVRLDRRYYDRYPDELSGGERQRVAIARALAAEPKLMLCDEVLSALDVSVQANIVELLVELQARRHIAYLFISHDLAVVRSLAHRVGVLYWGALCEVGTAEEVFTPPFHPYTYLLLSAVPEADPDQLMPEARKDIGLIVSDDRPACPFALRCPWKDPSRCSDEAPPWQQISRSHMLRCHVPVEELRQHDVWADRFGHAG